MEKLYIHLKQASLSPIGDRKPSTKREFRASFVKRCKNQTVNDKLHRIRTLNSTLKVIFHFFPHFFSAVCPLLILHYTTEHCAIIHFFFALFLTQSKEADLQAIEQVLSNPELNSDKFREWKDANAPLVQEICVKQDQQVASEATKAAASVIAAPVVETSLWRFRRTGFAVFGLGGLHTHMIWMHTLTMLFSNETTVTYQWTYFSS